MGAKICMNTFCGATASTTWKRGWELRSGQIADLCLNCGSAYEKLAYCDTFHSEETGWRECSLCNKCLHCGCSASLPFIEIQDFGGVWCINCARTAGCHKNLRDVLPSEAPKQGSYASCELQDSRSNDKVDVDSHNDGRLLKLGILSNSMCFGRQMDTKSPIEFSYKGFENVSQPLMEPPKLAKPSDDLPNIGVRDVQEPKVLPSLNINLGASDSKSFSLALPGGTEERENNRPSVSQSMQKACHILPKPSKNNLPKSSDANKRSASQKRLARPPAEARLRNQLLPRYWPRITDQELQKLSGDLNSTIVPLFEKVLSVSDASRIGRLVLPKACAEAYFPQINQSEGLPLRVQDVKGNEWTFQFRFWPNNNSRMYVLEGVTPCMQTMQLEAGDTVTFSRIDPGGKLIIGSRKTSNSLETQDQQIPASHNGMVSEDNPYSDVSDSPATVNGYTGLIQSFKRGKENSLNVSSEHSNTLNGDVGWSKNENFKGKVVKDLLRQPKFSSEAKALTVGPKSKKILMHSEDAMELRMSWGETHDLLRPPPNIQPHIVVVEEFEFEEYDEPPVFGKRTLFTTGLLGVQNQWARCDKCEKWRKLPLDVLLPPKWSCLDNVWNLSRSSCSAPEEISSEELDQFLRVGKDSKKRKVSERSDAVQGCKASGLDALANAAVLGDPAASRESVEPSSGATTRHPRHRPGCTCIVCIQPPSGKGKHESDCSCNVCLTVKRRFKTLMMRKKQKRQCEREAEKAEHKRSQNDYPTTEPSSLPVPPIDTLQIDVVKQSLLEENEGGCKEIIDLNCHPAREDDMQTEAPSMLNDHISQNETASLLFDNGIKEGGNNHDLPEPKNMAEPSDEPENVVSVTVDEVIDRESISIVNLIESSRTYKLTSFGD